MTRSEILTRYRHLRQITRQHHHDILNIIAPDVMLAWAKRLGMTQGKVVVFDTENEMTLVEDLATYQPRLGSSHPIDRYARAAQFAPDSDDVIVLDAMRHSRFSIWRIERRDESVGLILRDTLRGGEIRLIDETMQQNPPLGLEIAGRILSFEDFTMVARIVVPVLPGLMNEVFDRIPALRRIEGDALAQDPRFVIAVYRAAVATGAMDTVRVGT